MKFYDYADKEIEYEHLILGKICGCLLKRRGKNDNHVSIVPLSEDDGHWFVDEGHGYSSYWLADKLLVLQETQAYLEANHDKDPSGYGYVFRE